MDSVGNSNLYGGVSATLQTDRFGNPNSGLSLSKGYIQVPNGIYFNGPFSITGWVYLISARWYARLLDFGVTSNQIILALFSEYVSQLDMYIVTLGGYTITRGAKFNFNEWTHIASTFDGTYVFIYINGNLKQKQIS